MKYFNLAKEISKASDFRRVHVGCVLVYKNRVINSACNISKTHPLQKIYNKERFSEDTIHSLHAEIHALIPFIHDNTVDDSIDWKHVQLYIYREKRDKPYGMARPCKSCMALIKKFGIRNIFYTTEDGFVHEKLDMGNF